MRFSQRLRDIPLGLLLSCCLCVNLGCSSSDDDRLAGAIDDDVLALDRVIRAGRALGDGEVYAPFEPVWFDLSTGSLNQSVLVEYTGVNGLSMLQPASPYEESGTGRVTYRVPVPPLNHGVSEIDDFDVAIVVDGNRNVLGRIGVEALPENQPGRPTGEIALGFLRASSNLIRTESQALSTVLENSDLTAAERDRLLEPVRLLLEQAARMENGVAAMIESGAVFLDSRTGNAVLGFDELAYLDRMYLGLSAELLGLDTNAVGRKLQSRISLEKDVFEEFGEQLFASYRNSIFGAAEAVSEVVGPILFVSGLVVKYAAAGTAVATLGPPLAVLGATVFLVTTMVPSVMSASVTIGRAHILDRPTEFSDIQPSLNHIVEGICDISLGIPGPCGYLSEVAMEGYAAAENLWEGVVELDIEIGNADLDEDTPDGEFENPEEGTAVNRPPTIALDLDPEGEDGILSVAEILDPETGAVLFEPFDIEYSNWYPIGTTVIVSATIADADGDEMRTTWCFVTESIGIDTDGTPIVDGESTFCSAPDTFEEAYEVEIRALEGTTITVEVTDVHDAVSSATVQLSADICESIACLVDTKAF